MVQISRDLSCIVSVVSHSMIRRLSDVFAKKASGSLSLLAFSELPLLLVLEVDTLMADI